MYVTKFKIGNIEVKYISAHFNHTIGPSEDAFLPLPTSTKEEIAMKLSLGISIERIMDGNGNYYNIPYSGKVWRGGKFGEFDESTMIRQTKIIR